MGECVFGLALWKRLKLDQIFERLQEQGREEISWADMFCVSAVARMCQPSSELAIAESWYEKTALEDLLGIGVDKVNESRLYRTLDHILGHKDDVCKHLQGRYAEWFGSKFDFLFYDITRTYFEGQARRMIKRNMGTAGIDGRTVNRYVLGRSSIPKDCQLGMKYSTETAKMLRRLNRWSS